MHGFGTEKFVPYNREFVTTKFVVIEFGCISNFKVVIFDFALFWHYHFSHYILVVSLSEILLWECIFVRLYFIC
jgi:hypothetical protein